MFKKFIAILICAVFLVEQTGFAQVAPQMPVPQYLQGLLTADKFRPMHLRSVAIDGDRTLKVLLERGDEKKLKEQQVQQATAKLLEYFQVGLALPNSTFWVNLRPDAADAIIDPQLEKTDLGRVLLEADLQLKKDMAALTDPNTPQGRQYWDKLYARAEALFAGEEAEIPTYNRPWIVPGEIIIGAGENGTAYVYKATLKVLLESDALVGSISGPQVAFSDPRLKELNEYSAQLIKQLILPQLTRQINANRKYAQLRQVYYSLILAQWFKQRSNGQTATKDLAELSSKEPWSKDTYFKEYRRSFQQGEYSRQEAVSGPSGLTVRRYFSGGFKMETLFDGGKAAAAAPVVTVVPLTHSVPGGISAVVSPAGQISVGAVNENIDPATAQNNDGGKDRSAEELMGLLADPDLSVQDIVREMKKRGADEAQLLEINRALVQRGSLIADASRVAAALSLASALAMLAGLTYALPVFILSALTYMGSLPAGTHYKDLRTRLERVLNSAEYLAGKDGGSWKELTKWVLDNETALEQEFRNDPQRVVRMVEDQIFALNLDNENLKRALSFLDGHIFIMQFTGEKQAAAQEIDFSRGPAWFSSWVRSLIAVFSPSAKYRAYKLVLATIRENTWGVGRDGGEAALAADMRARLDDIDSREQVIKELEKSADPQVWEERQAQVHIKQIDYNMFMHDARELARSTMEGVADAAKKAASLAKQLFDREEEIEALRHREPVGAVDAAHALVIKERDRLHEELVLAMDDLETQIDQPRPSENDGGNSAEVAEELITFVIRHRGYSPVEIVGFMEAQGLTGKADLEVLNRAASIALYMMKDSQSEAKEYRMSRKSFFAYAAALFAIFSVTDYFSPGSQTGWIAAYGPYALHLSNAATALAAAVVYRFVVNRLFGNMKLMGPGEMQTYTKISAVLDLLKERYDTRQPRDGGKTQQRMRVVLFEWASEFSTVEKRLKAMIEDKTLRQKLLVQIAAQFDVTDPDKDFSLNITDQTTGQLYLSRTEEEIIANADAYVQTALINMAQDEAVKYAIRDRAKVLLQLIDQKAAREKVFTEEAAVLIDRINGVLGLGIKGPEDVVAILRSEGALEDLSSSVVADAKKLTVSFYSAVRMGTGQKWAARARNALLLGSVASTVAAFLTGRPGFYVLSPILLALTLVPWLRNERSARVLTSDQKTVQEVVRLLEKETRASKDGGQVRDSELARATVNAVVGLSGMAAGMVTLVFVAPRLVGIVADALFAVSISAGVIVFLLGLDTLLNIARDRPTLKDGDDKDGGVLVYPFNQALQHLRSGTEQQRFQGLILLEQTIAQQEKALDPQWVAEMRALIQACLENGSTQPYLGEISSALMLVFARDLQDRLNSDPQFAMFLKRRDLASARQSIVRYLDIRSGNKPVAVGQHIRRFAHVRSGDTLFEFSFSGLPSWNVSADVVDTDTLEQGVIRKVKVSVSESARFDGGELIDLRDPEQVKWKQVMTKFWGSAWGLAPGFVMKSTYIGPATVAVDGKEFPVDIVLTLHTAKALVGRLKNDPDRLGNMLIVLDRRLFDRAIARGMKVQEKTAERSGLKYYLTLNNDKMLDKTVVIDGIHVPASFSEKLINLFGPTKDGGSAKGEQFLETVRKEVKRARTSVLDEDRQIDYDLIRSSADQLGLSLDDLQLARATELLVKNNLGWKRNVLKYAYSAFIVVAAAGMLLSVEQVGAFVLAGVQNFLILLGGFWGPAFVVGHFLDRWKKELKRSGQVLDTVDKEIYRTQGRQDKDGGTRLVGTYLKDFEKTLGSITFLGDELPVLRSFIAKGRGLQDTANLNDEYVDQMVSLGLDAVNECLDALFYRKNNLPLSHQHARELGYVDSVNAAIDNLILLALACGLHVQNDLLVLQQLLSPESLYPAMNIEILRARLQQPGGRNGLYKTLYGGVEKPEAVALRSVEDLAYVVPGDIIFFKDSARLYYYAGHRGSMLDLEEFPHRESVPMVVNKEDFGSMFVVPVGGGGVDSQARDGGKQMQATLDDFRGMAPSTSTLNARISADQPFYHLSRLLIKRAAGERVAADRLAMFARQAGPQAQTFDAAGNIAPGDIVYLQDGRFGAIDLYSAKERRLIFDVFGEDYSGSGIKTLITDPAMISSARFVTASQVFGRGMDYCMAKVRLMLKHIEKLERMTDGAKRSAAARRSVKFYAQKFNRFRSAARNLDGGQLPAGLSTELFETLETDVLFRLEFHDTAVQRYLGWMDAQVFSQALRLREGSQVVLDATQAVNKPLPYEQAVKMARSGDYAVYAYRVDSIAESDKLYVLYPTDAEFKRLASEQTAVRMDGGTAGLSVLQTIEKNAEFLRENAEKVGGKSFADSLVRAENELKISLKAIGTCDDQHAAMELLQKIYRYPYPEAYPGKEGWIRMSRSVDLRVAILHAFGDIGTEEAVDFLLNELNRSAGRVRHGGAGGLYYAGITRTKAVLAALAKTRSKKAVPVLEEIVNEYPPNALFDDAIKALERIEPRLAHAKTQEVKTKQASQAVSDMVENALFVGGAGLFGAGIGYVAWWLAVLSPGGVAPGTTALMGIILPALVFAGIAAWTVKSSKDGGVQARQDLVDRLDASTRELLRLEQELAIIPDSDHSPLARKIQIIRLNTSVYETYGKILNAVEQVEEFSASVDPHAAQEARSLRSMAAHVVVDLLHLSRVRMELEIQKQEKPVTATRMIEQQIEPVRTALAMCRSALFDCLEQVRNAAQGEDFAAGNTLAESFPTIAAMVEADMKEIEETIARMESEKILLAPWKQGMYDKMIERQKRLLDEKRELLGKDGGVEAYLRGKGIQNVEQLVGRYPALLEHDLEREIMPVVEYLESLNVNLPLVIRHAPQLLLFTDVRIFKKKVAYFRSLGVGRIHTMLNRAPFVLSLSLEDNIMPKAAYLRSIGVSQVGTVLERAPSMLALSLTDNIKPKVDYLRSQGVENVGRVIEVAPAFLSLSLENNLKPKIDVLKKASGDDLAAVLRMNPTLLAASLDKSILPKLLLFKRAGISIGTALRQEGSWAYVNVLMLERAVSALEEANVQVYCSEDIVNLFRLANDICRQSQGMTLRQVIQRDAEGEQVVREYLGKALELCLSIDTSKDGGRVLTAASVIDARRNRLASMQERNRVYEALNAGQPLDDLAVALSGSADLSSLVPGDLVSFAGNAAVYYYRGHNGNLLELETYPSRESVPYMINEDAFSTVLVIPLAESSVSRRDGGEDAVEKIFDLYAILDRKDNFEERSAAVFALAEIDHPLATRTLIKALKNDDFWGIRKDAAVVLPQVAQEREEAMEALREVMLHDEDWGVRQAAADALGQMKAHAYADSLSYTMVKDEDWGVRKAALRSLVQLQGGETADLLMRSMVYDPDWGVRKAAARALGHINSKEALPLLESVAENETEWGVQQAAEEAVKKLRGQREDQENKDGGSYVEQRDALIKKIALQVRHVDEPAVIRSAQDFILLETGAKAFFNPGYNSGKVLTPAEALNKLARLRKASLPSLVAYSPKENFMPLAQVEAGIRDGLLQLIEYQQILFSGESANGELTADVFLTPLGWKDYFTRDGGKAGVPEIFAALQAALDQGQHKEVVGAHEDHAEELKAAVQLFEQGNVPQDVDLQRWIGLAAHFATADMYEGCVVSSIDMLVSLARLAHSRQDSVDNAQELIRQVLDTFTSVVGSGRTETVRRAALKAHDQVRSLQKDGGKLSTARPGLAVDKSEVGGIDLRALPLNTVPMSAAHMQMTAVSTVPLTELDKEWAAIVKQMQSGPMPYAALKEHVRQCSGRQETAGHLQEVSACVMNILEMEEDAAVVSAAELKEVLCCLS